jgi:hypothetical protein
MDLKIVRKSLMIIDLSNKDLNKKMTSLNRVMRKLRGGLNQWKSNKEIIGKLWKIP